MWGIFVGSLIFVFGIMLLSPYGFSPAGLLVAAIGMTIALMATARYAVDLLAGFVTVKPSIKQTVYDDTRPESTLPEQPAT